MTSLKTIKIQLECSICTEAYKCDDEMTIIEPCNHQFHDKCIQTWFETKTECPMCRYPILTTFQKEKILRMCVLNRICKWFENTTLYLDACEEIKGVLTEFDIDTIGFNMSNNVDLNSRDAVVEEIMKIKAELKQLFGIADSAVFLEHPLILPYNKKVHRYVPLTHIIRRHPKPVGVIGGIVNMGKALLGMER
jgi:hypothetical protein